MKSRKPTKTLADLEKKELVDDLLDKVTGGATATCYNLPTTCVNAPTTCFNLPTTCFNLPTTCVNLPATCYNLPG